MTTIDEIREQVEARVAATDDDPAARRVLYDVFYTECGSECARYGRASLAFVDWELERGVLASATAERPGSAWWRALNRRLLSDGMVALLARTEGVTSPETLAAPLALWVQFFEGPSIQTWYRAHNSSVIAGYLEFVDLARDESPAEQALMNAVLYRVLYAQALAEQEREAFAPVSRALRELSDPGSSAIGNFLQIAGFYPRTYPLTGSAGAEVFGPGTDVTLGAAVVLDGEVIVRRLSRLYGRASQWNVQPRLGLLCRENRPIYPELQTVRRIAVLGGGVGAITAALALTDPDNAESARNQVTLYQIGWRLGGKCSSGRAMDAAGQHRIEEHGLHIWFGFYENAFRTTRRLLSCLTAPHPLTGRSLRPPDGAMVRLEDAFKPYPMAFIAGSDASGWQTWYAVLPPNDVLPDERGTIPLDQALRMAVEFVIDGAAPKPGVDPSAQAWDGAPWTIQVLRRVQTAVASDLASELAYTLRRFEAARWASGEVGALVARVLEPLMALYWRGANVAGGDYFARERWSVINLVYACVRGVFAENLIARGLDSVNDLEFREWIGRHQYPDEGVLQASAYLRSIYDGSFAYRGGDNGMHGGTFPPHGDMEAGTTLRNALRTLSSYKQASIFKMQGPMGDLVFGPAFEVLRDRGVRFEFFHRVLSVTASDDARRVERIHIAKQARVISGSYEPLVDVRGLPSWPDRPLYDQLEPISDDQPLEDLDLEDYENGQVMEEFELAVDEDFDDVVLGISLGAIPQVCADLVGKSTAWRDMVTKVETIATQGAQVWLDRTPYELGWRAMMRPIVSGFKYSSANPFETWADMSHVLEREGWSVDPPSPYPRSVIYFCSSLIEPTYPEVPSPHERQRLADAKVRAEVEAMLPDWLDHAAGMTSGPEAAARLEDFLTHLIDRREVPGVGIARLDAQHFVGNVKPTERYVLSVRGSSRYRLGPNDPQEFANLYLAGDWTDNHVNMGCVEAAVTSGLLCSNALSGFPMREGIGGLTW